MDRRAIVVLLALCYWMTACSQEKQTAVPTSGSGSQPAAESESQPAKTGEVPAGEASGSFTAKGGEKVDLKYAYAGRGKRFDEDSVIVLVTDKPIPPEALVEELEDQTMLFEGKVRGLEYVFMKDGYWVRYHPGQYQESRSLNQLKEYAVADDMVKGLDESDGSVSDGNYARSVRFVAALTK